MLASKSDNITWPVGEPEILSKATVSKAVPITSSN
jgi:hypothetical protein